MYLFSDLVAGRGTGIKLHLGVDRLWKGELRASHFSPSIV